MANIGPANATQLSPDHIIDRADKAAHDTNKKTSKRRYKLLDLREAEKLSDTFIFWRRFYQDNQLGSRLMQARIQLDEALALAVQKAAKYIDLVQTLPDRFLSRWLPDAAHVDRVKMIMLGLLPPNFNSEAIKQMKANHRRFQWHFIAGALASEIGQAMKVTNPEYRSGLGSVSTPGPTARIMAEFIPSIVGENPTPRAIASYLSKQISRWKKLHEP